MTFNTNNDSKLTKFAEWVKWFTRRGQEHITVMLVPHNEQKIVKFQISWFAIWFIAVLVVVLLASSIFTFAGFQTKSRIISNMYSTERSVRISRHILHRELKQQQDMIYQIKKEMCALAANIGMPEASSMWSVGGPAENEMIVGAAAEMNEAVPKPSEVELVPEALDISGINGDLSNMLLFTRQISERIEFDNELFYDIPSIWPVKGEGHITSTFGWRRDPFRPSRLELHQGLDIAGFIGTPVVATADGVVSFSGWQGGYGHQVIIRHKYGFSTVYGHLQRKYVYAGQTVKRGDVIGAIGSTGRSTGSHLHYEVRIGSQPVNPEEFILKVTTQQRQYVPENPLLH